MFSIVYELGSLAAPPGTLDLANSKKVFYHCTGGATAEDMAPSGLFEGRVFGLTGELPRKELEAALKANGAKVSAIIHKRVTFVVCTPDAVKYNTQKVRKAAKHGIPLVSKEFIAACAAATRVVDPAPFRITETDSSSASSAPGTDGSKQPTEGATNGGGGGGEVGAATEAATSLGEGGVLETPGSGGVDTKPSKTTQRRRRDNFSAAKTASGEGGVGEVLVGASPAKGDNASDRRTKRNRVAQERGGRGNSEDAVDREGGGRVPPEEPPRAAVHTAGGSRNKNRKKKKKKKKTVVSD